MEIFWRTIAYYNSATWLLQIIVILIGIVLTALLISKPRPWVKMGMKIYMIGLYSWISIVYYFIYCEERSYNGVMAMFWGVMAIIWIWDTITGYTTFERTHKYDLLSYVLLAMPFIYPMVSLARGLSFPEMTSPVMPCSVVVFTIGLSLYPTAINYMAVCAKGQYVFGIVPLPLVIDRIIQDLLLPDTGRLPFGKCDYSGTLSLLQRILPE